jgi:hypothetical protein
MDVVHVLFGLMLFLFVSIEFVLPQPLALLSNDIHPNRQIRHFKLLVSKAF